MLIHSSVWYCIHKRSSFNSRPRHRYLHCVSPPTRTVSVKVYPLSVILRTVSDVMSCHAMSCHVMSCHVMSCPVMSCHVMSCHVMSCHVMSCHVMSCHVMSCHVMDHLVSSQPLTAEVAFGSRLLREAFIVDKVSLE